jgi:transposase-like protein
MDKRTQQRIEKAAQARDRARAEADARFRQELAAVYDEGHSLAAIGDVLRVSRQYVFELLHGKRQRL